MNSRPHGALCARRSLWCLPFVLLVALALLGSGEDGGCGTIGRDDDVCIGTGGTWGATDYWPPSCGSAATAKGPSTEGGEACRCPSARPYWKDGIGCSTCPATPRNLVLCYTDSRADTTWDRKKFLPLVSHVDAQGKPQHAGFDDFLFLGINAPSGRCLSTGCSGGNATGVEFTWFRDRLFSTGKQVLALQQAVDDLPAELRRTIGVIVAIPYPINAEWKSRTSTIRNFITGVVDRFAWAKFANLKLKGFYWMREERGEGGDDNLIRETAMMVHKTGLGFYWIPYFSGGNDGAAWKEIGFDYAYLQPNYAFRDVTTQRFADVEARRQATGAGIEMELALYTRNQRDSWKASLVQYFNHALKYGWMKLQVAWYYGNAFVTMRTSNYGAYELIDKFRAGTLTQADVNAWRAANPG